MNIEDRTIRLDYMKRRYGLASLDTGVLVRGEAEMVLRRVCDHLARLLDECDAGAVPARDTDEGISRAA